MRKFISIIFISLFCSNVALAAITCTPLATTECEVGCYVSGIHGCTSCNDGYYTDAKGQEACKKCNKPEKATFITPGTSVDDCSWEMTCNAGTYYVSDTTNSGCQPCPGNTFTNEKKETTDKGYGTTQACEPCGANSTANPDHTNCNCKDGYHFTDSEGKERTQNTDGKDCEPDKYTITYKSNNEKNQTKTQAAHYNSIIRLYDENTFTDTGRKLSGWKYQEVYTPGGQLEYTFTSDITLIAQWEQKQFTVTYIDGSCDDQQQTQRCSYDSPMGCLALSPTCANNGYHFLGWKCKYGCQKSEIKIGTDISKISDGENMTLTAVWEECPIGHYCENIKTKSECPAGSTSNAGSMKKTDCYIQGGTTQICDKANQCFTLPTSAGKIYLSR